MALLNLTNKSDRVNYIGVTHKDFDNMAKIFNKFYKKIETNDNNMNHIFSYNDDDIVYHVYLSVCGQYYNIDLYPSVCGQY